MMMGMMKGEGETRRVRRTHSADIHDVGRGSRMKFFSVMKFEFLCLACLMVGLTDGLGRLVLLLEFIIILTIASSLIEKSILAYPLIAAASLAVDLDNPASATVVISRLVRDVLLRLQIGAALAAAAHLPTTAR
jgi:hypothetical protein